MSVSVVVVCSDGGARRAQVVAFFFSVSLSQRQHRVAFILFLDVFQRFLSVLYFGRLRVLCAAAVLASTTVCKQRAHLLLAIFAAFLWSCAIGRRARWIALFRPLGAPLWVVALCAVVLQELARWATYALSACCVGCARPG